MDFYLEDIAKRYDAVFLDTNVVMQQLPGELRGLAPAELTQYTGKIREALDYLTALRFSEGSFYVTDLIIPELEGAFNALSDHLRVIHGKMGEEVPRERPYHRRRSRTVKAVVRLKEGDALDGARGQYASSMVALTRLSAQFSHLLQELPVYPLPFAIPKPEGKPSCADASLILAMIDYVTRPGHDQCRATVVSYDYDIPRLFVHFAEQQGLPPSVSDRMTVHSFDYRQQMVLELSTAAARNIVLRPGRPDR